MTIYKAEIAYEEYRTRARLYEWKYFVTERYSDQYVAIYEYSTIKTEYPKQMLSLCTVFCAKQCDITSMRRLAERVSGHGTNASIRMIEVKADGILEYIPVPTEYSGYKTLERVVVTDSITQDEKIISTIRMHHGADMSPVVLIGEDRSKAVVSLDAAAGYYSDNVSYVRHYCKKCGCSYFPEHNKGYYARDFIRRCPNCGNEARANTLESEDYNTAVSGRVTRHRYRKDPLSKSAICHYAKAVENGIIIYQITYQVKAKDGQFIESFKADNMVRHVYGEDMGSYRILKRGLKVTDPFTALHINTKTIEKFTPLIYEGYGSFLEYALDNQKFLQWSGFLQISKYSVHIKEPELFFVLFIAIMNKYPVLEQIVKMGYTSLFNTLYDSIINSENMEEIQEKANALEQLVNMEATKGRGALRFPPYIGEYLREKSADLSEYYIWRDVYEITQMTKEQFEEVINSIEYAFVVPYCDMARIANALKFGYPMLKLLRYLLKGASGVDRITDRLQLLTDYLNMCDILQVSVDLYPSDLGAAHDRVTMAFREATGGLSKDTMIYMVGSQAAKYVVPSDDRLDDVGIPALFKTHTVVFPTSVNDFIDEGNQQHNCVGSYPSAVRSGKTVVFFIRRKDNIGRSFITAECTRAGLGQMYYSNNRPVRDPQLRKFGKYVANKILAGCRSGAIAGLGFR